MSDITKSLLEAPCRWCGYSGEGYWQKNTHDKHCIWHDVGGADNRETKLSEFGRIKQSETTYKNLNLDSVGVIKDNELFNKEGDLHG